MTANTIAPPEPPPAASSSIDQFLGRWIRSQRPVPAAVGELKRSALLPVSRE
ncbi:MAG: hypothetical protein RIS76_4436 [Verrucomicrobiota bacterium]|jgi:hypothetical protein